MRLRGLLWFNAVFSIMPVALLAGVVVEGRVELPKSHSAPVQAKRYEIVTKGGVLVTQQDLTFVPALLPIRVGTRVEFPNLDDTYHNIFSYSPAKRSDVGRYRAEERPIPAEVFDKPGLVTLRCDIHEHMRGLILVLNTPYFVMTDTDGHFRLRGLPAGRYILKAWIDSRTTREKPVELKNGQTLRVDFP